MPKRDGHGIWWGFHTINMGSLREKEGRVCLEAEPIAVVARVESDPGAWQTT
ncbi:MAG: hypothetical protein ACLQRM_16995 [Acidimicrobiales bacterium]